MVIEYQSSEQLITCLQLLHTNIHKLHNESYLENVKLIQCGTVVIFSYMDSTHELQ